MHLAEVLAASGVSDGGFPAAARLALADESAAKQPRRGHAAPSAPSAPPWWTEVPDWQELRDAGAAIKARALATLPEQLERLEREVAAAGGTVHWARDAAEANAKVIGLARERGAGEVIKVKSLATDEIELNAALATAGIRAGRDRPRRADHPARRGPSLAHPGAGDPPQPRRDPRAVPAHDRARGAASEEPEALAETARRYLRERFLSAPMAVSGANFGVAETGSVCVVESEGNGRFCTTVPDTLVTVMGIEKVRRRVARTWRSCSSSCRAPHRRAHEPLHVDLDRRAPRRRAARVPPDPARRRPHRRAGGRGGPPGAALHPLLGLPERVPRVLAHGRARLRLGLSRADRSDPDAAAAGARRAPRCPTPRACAAPVTRSAR